MILLNINKKDVANRIRRIRQERGMTMEEFGKIFNTSKNSVSNWENARNLPNNARLLEIAEYSNITLEELLYGDPKVKITLDSTLHENLKEFVDRKREVIKQEVKLLAPAALSGILTLGFGFKDSRAKAIEDYETHRNRIKIIEDFGHKYIDENYDNYNYDKFLQDFPNSNPQDFEEYKEKEWSIFEEVLEDLWKTTDPDFQKYTWINERFTDQISNELDQIMKVAIEENKELYYVNEVVQPFLDQAAKDFKEYIKEYIDTED